MCCSGWRRRFTGLAATRAAPSRTARGGAGTAGRGLRRALIAAEVALALVLLTGGGLLLQTFVRLQSANLGFDPRNVLVALVNPPRTAYDTMAKHRAYYDQVLEKAAALPGVRSVALSSVLPLEAATATWTSPSTGFPRLDAHRKHA